MDTSPETWRWVWLVVTLVLVGGEMAVPGTFILLPFGIGAAVATLLAFLDVPLGYQWGAMLIIGVVLFALFWRMAKRFASDNVMPVGVGSDRLVGELGRITEEVPSAPTGSGVVLLGAERWRAESNTGQVIPPDTVVRVVAVRGTRVRVEPSDATEPTPVHRDPSEDPAQGG